MPYIGTRVTVSLSKEKESELKEKLGKAIETIPGKTERWLMTEFQDNCRIWFAGDNSKPAAFIEVKILGGEDSDAFSKMSGVLTKIMSESLGIPGDRVYIVYQPISSWGWNGSNF